MDEKEEAEKPGELPSPPPKTWKAECDLCEYAFIVITNYGGEPSCCPVCGNPIQYVR